MAKRPPKLRIVPAENALPAQPSSTRETDTSSSADPDATLSAAPNPVPTATPPTTNPAPAAEGAASTGAAFILLLKAVARDIVRLGRWSKPRAQGAARLSLAGFQKGVSTLRAAKAAAVTVTQRQRRAKSSGNSAGTAECTDSQDAIAALPLAGPSTQKSDRHRLLIGLACCFGFLIAGTAATMVWALQDVSLEEIATGHVPNQVIALSASDGQPLIQLGPYQEVAATREQFPEHLVQAVLAIEDRRFFDHWGVDVWGVTRALSRNLFAGEVREGGSTITQQLLKILYLDPDRTVRRKVQELFLSLWVESRLSKDEILTLYLNNVYLGAGATGMPAAARLYFDKAVQELTLPESAMLAGLIAAPSALNPLENLEEARGRASVVLQAMQAAGFLDEGAVLQAQANSAQLQPQRPSLGTGTWFADWAMREAQDISGQFLGSVKVSTTLVPELQTLAEQMVQLVMADQGSQSGAGQAAMVVLAPDGAVLAMVGGLDYGQSQFNRALAMRQPGSTFKLFTYYAALKMGASPEMRLEDRPIEVDGWQPENIDGEYSGRVSMAEAFARSLNAATVQLGMDVGLANIVAAARELGIEAPLQETPSLILGSSEVSLLDITGAYASIRAGLSPVEPYGIRTFEAANGRPFSIGPKKAAALSLGDLHPPMLGLLQLVVERGTGEAAALDRFAAGKTGTSQDYRDAWFIGFDQNYTVGVWVGNDDSSPMDKVTGGQLPAVIWQKFMAAAAPTELLQPFASEGDDEQNEVGAPPQCNIQACSRAYRSFRASDCTFQPYRGPRRICEK
jgi:1A family penicillin-binding protein